MNINRITTDTADNVRYDYTLKEKRLPEGLIPLAIVAIAAVIGIWLLTLAITAINCTFDYHTNCPAFDIALWSLPITVAVGLCIALVAAVLLAVQASRNAEYLHWRGVVLHREDIRQLAPYVVEVARRSAQSEATAGLDALTLHNTPTIASAPPVPSERLLAASESDDLIVAPGEWLEWLDRQPHVILAAETGGGKSTTAKAILANRIKAGEDILVIDPHSSEWFDLPSVGGGEDWNAIRNALEIVSNEYRKRLEERDRYKQETGKELPVSHFKRLTVLLDEANNTRAALDVKRNDNNTWQSFAKTLGSGARKVGISIILLCQSANVEDLGLSGAMRQNFTRIGLDDRVIKQIIAQDEKDNERRKRLYAALVDRSYPAACEMDGRVYLLDRTGLDTISVPTAKHCAWNINTGGNGAKALEIEPVQNANIRGIADIDVKSLLVAMKAQGYTEDVQIAALVKRGLSANKIYELLGGERNAKMRQIKEVRNMLK